MSKPSREKSVCLGLFLICAALNLGLSVVGWWHNLREVHEFRQTQTALAARYFQTEGWSLAGPLPLFGPPWSAPMEFPLYQYGVARLSTLAGTPLEPTGRLVSLFFLYLSLPAFYLLLRHVGVPPQRRWLLLALVLVTPVYLYYSRSFMIESSALCAAVWFLHAYCRALETVQLKWIAGGIGLGSLAALTKITTFVIILFPAIAFTLWILWCARPESGGTLRRQGVLAVTGLGMALAALAVGVAWVAFGDAIKGSNPLSQFLVSAQLHDWNYGTLALRVNPKFWQALYEHTGTSVLPIASLAALFGATAFIPPADGKRVLVLIGCYLTGPLVFSNLYFLHDYYFYATGFFLLIAFVVAWSALLDRAGGGSVVKWLVLVLTLAAQVFGFTRTYFQVQKRGDFEYPELYPLLGQITAPNDILLLQGCSWNPAIPYVSGRKAIMVADQYARDPALLDEVLSRLPKDQVGALVVAGPLRRESSLIHGLVTRLNLVETPLLQSDDTDVFIARRRLSFAIPRVEAMHPRSLTAHLPMDLHYHGIGQRRYRVSDLPDPAMVAMFSPRPTEILAPFGLGTTMIDGKTGLNAHAPTRVTMNLPSVTGHLTADYGIIPKAYTGAGKTDGVEFQIELIEASGRTTVLFDRLLDPVGTPGDRGRQHLEIALPVKAACQLIFSTLPGPADNISFDWAYWTSVEVK